MSYNQRKTRKGTKRVMLRNELLYYVDTFSISVNGCNHYGTVYIYNGWHEYFYVKDITLSNQQVIIIQLSSMELLSVPYLGFTSHKFPIFMATIPDLHEIANSLRI